MEVGLLLDFLIRILNSFQVEPQIKDGSQMKIPNEDSNTLVCLLFFFGTLSQTSSITYPSPRISNKIL